MRLRRFVPALCGFVGAACIASPPPPRVVKDDPHEVYLPNWSQAGYRFGQDPPQLQPTHSVSDFGAVPNDEKDDTEAFRRALAEAQAPEGQHTVVRVPRGTYELSEILFITRDRVVLKGEGSGKSVLRFTRPLADMSLPQRVRDLEAYLRDNDKRVDGELFSRFSWTGGVIWVRSPTADQIAFDGLGPLLGAPVSVVGGHRGAHEVTLSDASGVREGSTYVLRWYNRAGRDSEFLRHLYGMEASDFGERLSDDPDRVLVQQDATVVAVQGNNVTIRQPLLHDVRSDFDVAFGEIERVEEVGIEGLSVRFPEQAYGGHHKEVGYNAFHLNDLRHGWLRDVVIENADSGVLTDRSSHLTLEHVQVRGRGGHYGIHFGSVYGNLARNFEIDAHFAHSVSFNTRCSGSVFHGGRVTDGSLDQHRGVNHQNLFDSVVAVESDGESRLFDHGGAGYWGPPHGGYNTFWNVQVQAADSTKLYLGAVEGAGPANLVGLRASTEVHFDYPSAQFQEASSDSIYLEQRAAR